MTTVPGYFDRKPTGGVRSGFSHLQTPPQTPTRTVSSVFSSPSNYRGEEDVLVFELGARHLRAGFAGEFYPRCGLAFGPEESRRVGDYRRWMPGFEEWRVRKRNGYDWGEDHELWRMDIRELELGLVEDKIERAVREAYSKYLLLDPKSRRLLLLLPSVMPHPLVSSIMYALFQNFTYSSITLLCTSVACLLGAGCRSGLVVDIGWSETVITSVYEYRELQHCRTSRAMKSLTREMGKMLYCKESNIDYGSPNELDLDADKAANTSINACFESCEEITTRMAWCQKIGEAGRRSKVDAELSQKLGHLSVAQDEDNNTKSHSAKNDDPFMSIPSPFSPRKNAEITFSHFAEPVETAFFAPGSTRYDTDDHEQPLHILIYKALVTLAPDVRSACMSRIIITGGGSNLPGLKSRLLDEVSKLVEDNSWDAVHGKAADERRRRLKETNNSRQRTTPHDDTSAAMAGQIPDPIEEKIHKEQRKAAKPYVSGVIRGVETLGAWAGGSLMADLKVQGIVEIDRDAFTQHGLAGAKTHAEFSVGSQQQRSYGVGVSRIGKTGRTLGGWA